MWSAFKHDPGAFAVKDLPQPKFLLLLNDLKSSCYYKLSDFIAVLGRIQIVFKECEVGLAHVTTRFQFACK